MPILFLRYNPDAYTIDGNECKTLMKERETELVSILTCESAKSVSKGKLGPDSEQTLAIRYMYYNQDGSGFPELVWDPEFNPVMRECVVV